MNETMGKTPETYKMPEYKDAQTVYTGPPKKLGVPKALNTKLTPQKNITPQTELRGSSRSNEELMGWEIAKANSKELLALRNKYLYLIEVGSDQKKINLYSRLLNLITAKEIALETETIKNNIMEGLK